MRIFRRFIEEEGYVVYELVRPTWRLGFLIDLDPKECGWYFITSDKWKIPIMESGRLLYLRKPLAWLLPLLTK